MSVLGMNSDLEKFIMKETDSYNAIAEAVKHYAVSHRNELEFLDDPNTSIEFEDITFQRAFNITTNEDTVEFDVIIDGFFSYNRNRRKGYDDESWNQWFILHCIMKITDRLESFMILRIESFTNAQKKKLPNAATGNFVPVIKREEYEAEAEAFLKAYCPEALTTVMQVSIREVVEQRMGLTVIDNIQLTKDLTIFGQVCFNDSTIKIYDADNNGYVPTEVKRGTILIDPETVYLRCVGCGNNTLAHEAFHWWRHRIYATVHGILRQEKNQISYRCSSAPARMRKEAATDEDWMEIQANAIAPKILMPKKQTEAKIKQLVAEYEFKSGASDSLQIIQTIIDELSAFYSVSKQAAKIRMIELGYPEAADVYNYDADCYYSSHEITETDAYQEILVNEEFRTLINMELFRFAEGCFVINTDKYLQQDDDGNYLLTEYAKENLADCALNFRYDALELIFEFNREQGVLYRAQRAPRAVTVYTPEYNEDLITKALDEVTAAQKAYDDAQALGDETAAQTLMRYMDQKKWSSAIFQTRTGLKTGHYSKIKNNPNRVFELPVLVSICVGLDLPHGKSLEILEKAGFKLNPQILEQSLYNHILSTAGMRNIYACNEFLSASAKKYNEKVRLLGSVDYDGDSA